MTHSAVRPAPRWTCGVQRRVLANGLTALAQRLDRPATAITVRVRAGFLDEPDDGVGLSHVLEHMLFKGTPTRAPGAMAKAIRAGGGYVNAGTSYDYTTYYAVLPPASTRAGLAVLGDAVMRSVLDEEELARELQVIIEEVKRKLDSPEGMALEKVSETLFAAHRLRRWRIGTPERLARFTRAEVAAYYRSRYVPARTIVSVVGPHEPVWMIGEVEQVFGDWTGAFEPIVPGPGEPERCAPGVLTLRGDVAQSHLVLGWRSAPQDHAAFPALTAAAATLGAGRGSLLYRALREPALAAAAAAYQYGAAADAGVFLVAVACEPARLDDVMAAVGAVRRSLIERGPSPDDAIRTAALLRARWAMHLETADGLSAALAAAEARGDVELVDREYAALDAVTPAEVRTVAAQYLQPEWAGAVVYHPQGAGDDLDREVVARALCREESFPVSAIAQPPPMRSGRGAALLRPLPDRTGGVLHVALPGCDLLTVRLAGTALATVGIAQVRGEDLAAPEAGLDALALRAAVRGAGELDSQALALAFERLGGVLAPAISADHFGFATTVVSDRVEDAAALLQIVWETPRFEPEVLQAERRTVLADAAALADDMYRYPVQLAAGARYPASRYGRPLLGTTETVRNLALDRVAVWYHAARAASRPVIVAVADRDPEALAEMLARSFASIPWCAGRSEPEILTPVEGGTVVQERERNQTALAMLFPGPDRRAPERHAAEVWAAVSGGLGGRLFESLRSRRSLAYSVVTVTRQRRAAGDLLVYLATSPAREEEARDAMLEELARFRTCALPADEIQDAIRYLAGQEAVARQTTQAIAGEVVDAWLMGEGLDELLLGERRFDGVTPQRLLTLAETVLRPARRVEGVLRGTRSDPGRS